MKLQSELTPTNKASINIKVYNAVSTIVKNYQNKSSPKLTQLQTESTYQ